MNELSRRNFGLLIAYVLPGLVILFGVGLVSPTAKEWLTSAHTEAGPSVGGFLYAFLFSIAAGVTTSAVRWLLVDKLHQLTGVKRPRLDLRHLEEHLQSFDRIVEDHYRYHEFYGGMLIATFFSFIVWRFQQMGMRLRIYDILFFTIEIVFAVASRDALRNYYGRAAQVLGTLNGEVSNDERIRPSRTGSDCDESEGEREGDSGGSEGEFSECFVQEEV